MRKLTIKREKSFVGCAMKMQVYIEDATSDELTMTVENGEEALQVGCRKIGELKNGEEKTFEIGEDTARVFVIADKLSKDYCNDCYRLPEGNEDIILSGKNKLNPAAGNAFRFNGNDGKTATESRKKGTKRGLLVLIASVVLGFLLGYGVMAGIFAITDGRERVFSSDEMSITLNEGFDEYSLKNYEAVYASKNVEILVFKNSFEDFGSSLLSATEFARAVLLNNKELSCEVTTKDGIAFYSYDQTLSNGEEYSYFVYTYKSDSAYWQFYFAVEKGKAKRYADDIAEWAGSVKFN